MPDTFGGIYLNKYNIMMGKADWMVIEPFVSLGGPRAQWNDAEWANPTDEQVLGNQDGAWIAKEMAMDPGELAALEEEARREMAQEDQA